MSPALPEKEAQAVDATETQDFTPVPPGIYPGRLREVTVGSGAKGPYWTWVYEIPDSDEYAEYAEYKNRRFWNTTSLSEAARFKLKETFDAFGVPSSTNTDELVGKVVALQVGQVTAQGGKQAGNLVNQVNKVVPISELGGIGAGSGIGDDDLFDD